MEPTEGAQSRGPMATEQEQRNGGSSFGQRHVERLRSLGAALQAAADGDFSRRLFLEGQGDELLDELAEAYNQLAARNDRLTTELERLAASVTHEGRLSERMEPDGVGWERPIEAVNTIMDALAAPLNRSQRALRQLAEGDLRGEFALQEGDRPLRGDLRELEQSLGLLVDRLRFMCAGVSRLARQMGVEGRLGLRAEVDGLRGEWMEMVESINLLSANLSGQIRSITRISTAVVAGDLSQKVTVEARGEILELKSTLNASVDRLRVFASEVTRVAREVGIEGRLGGQAAVPDLSGTWKELAESVNLMASNLTDQVRGISRVVTAVANGDLSQWLTLVARGEIATLADTINGMTGTLRTFSDQVTTVAREVGTEGRLGGQAMVPRASGTWADLTDNVNRLAANLTIQVRAISNVATAVIEGDLSRRIDVEAQGEVLALKDTINQMIANLRDTTRANREQDWLKSNLARFFALMQGQRSLEALANQIVSELTPAVEAQRGAFYLFDEERQQLQLVSTYAATHRHRLSNLLRLGEGLVGQCALERKPIVISEVPPDYVKIGSALGEAAPREIAVFPILYEGRLKGVIELASFRPFEEVRLNFIEQLLLNVGLAINLIRASMRMEQVLDQLKGSNDELHDRRAELEDKARLLEVRNREIAEASRTLETKAEELARVSRYKSEFLANMSHEIRTPLNSMLILAQMLAANEDKRLSEKQEEWASTIHSAGRDLLVLINQVLDLSKVESGRLETYPESCSLDELEGRMRRTFRPVALQKGIDFEIARTTDVPEVITTDRQLLEQILINLLSNAFKFTDEGQIRLEIRHREDEEKDEIERLAFSVIDTGVGIPKEAQARIFEAFSQVDGSMTRRFEGTGLGLAISLEYAHLLGGTIELQSEVGTGSTFTLVLPVHPPGEALELPLSSQAILGGAKFPRAAAPPEDRHQGEESPEGPGGKEVGQAPDARERPPAPPERSREDDEVGKKITQRGGAASQRPHSAESDAREALASKTVLMVEDDVRNLYATTALLESMKVRVIPAPDAEAAFAALENEDEIDIVIMDVMMPKIDGYQAIQRIRSMPRWSKIPIVVFTAKASQADRRKALEVGADDFLIKPVEIDHLAKVLQRNLTAH